MEYLIVAVFFIGYLFITVEHQVKIDKTISALGMAVICWTILKTADLSVFEVSETNFREEILRLLIACCFITSER